jgi:hypothetical protein
MADHPIDHTDDGQLPFYGVLGSLIFGLGACVLIALHLYFTH